MGRLMNLAVILLLGIIIAACSSTPAKATSDQDLRNPRFSPDGKTLMFDRCDPSLPDRCRIHLYNLETGTLRYYLPPEGQAWLQPYFSKDGKKIVFVTGPVGDHDKSVYEQRYQILLNQQIAMMNLDGSDVRVLTTISGYKGMPAFSHSGDKVIFLMTNQLRDRGKTLAADWDLWELDLKTGSLGLFAGQRFRFFQMNLSVYFKDDQRVLVKGDTPIMIASDARKTMKEMTDFNKRHNNSNIHVIERGQQQLSTPLFSDLYSASRPCMDDQESIYFIAADNKMGGGKIRREMKDGKRDTWPFPKAKSSHSFWGTAVSPDGKYFALSVSLDERRTLMILDTTSSTWQEIILPKEASQINKPKRSDVNLG